MEEPLQVIATAREARHSLPVVIMGHIRIDVVKTYIHMAPKCNLLHGFLYLLVIGDHTDDIRAVRIYLFLLGCMLNLGDFC